MVVQDEAAGAVQTALAGEKETASGIGPFRPTPREVQALIGRARRHPLGVDFLLRGDLGAVAATFRVHAFTVDAARQRLRQAED